MSERINDEILAKAIEFQDVPEVKLVLIDLRDTRAKLKIAKTALDQIDTTHNCTMPDCFPHRICDIARKALREIRK